MLSLRQFDSTTGLATFSLPDGSLVRERTTSTVLEFAAQPGNALPRFIASFAHPVHIESEMGLDAIPEESSGSRRRPIDVEPPTAESSHY